MKELIQQTAPVACLIIMVSASFGQIPNKMFALAMENKRTHQQVLFFEGDRLRVELKLRSMRGELVTITDSTIFFRYWGVKNLITEKVDIKSIVGLARLKKIAPVVLGSILIAGGGISLIGGASLASEPDPHGFVIISNRSMGQAEMVFGGLLIAAGTPLVLPKRTYSRGEWNFSALAIP